MDWSVVIPRSRSARIVAVAVLVVLVAVCAAALVRSGPAQAARHATLAESVLTVRSDGAHDDLWLLSTTGGEAKRVAELPGKTSWLAVSLDGTTVACLPGAESKAAVWIGYGPGSPKTISLDSVGIKTLNYLTWTSNTQLIIAGSKKASDHSGYNDRLYTVDVTTGAVAPFRNLTGAQPSVSPATGKLVYVQFKKLDNGSKKNDYTPKYRESLMLTTLTGSGAGTALDLQEYRPVADYRAFNYPQIAAGGFWVSYAQTGSDVSASYYISYLGDDYMMPWTTTWTSSPVAMAWAPSSPLLAFGAEAAGPSDSMSCLYLVDPTGGATGRTPRDLLSKAGVAMVQDIDWSDGTQLVLDGTGANPTTGTSADYTVLLLDTKDTSKVTDLGEGFCSVWVR